MVERRSSPTLERSRESVQSREAVFVEKSGQRYSPVLDNPEHNLEQLDEQHDLMEIELGGGVSQKLRLLWTRRRTLWRFAIFGLVASIIFVLLWPKRYESTVRLMPPDNSGGALAALAAMGGRSDALSMVGSLLGTRTSGALFV